MKKLALATLMSSLIFSSCKKDNNETPDPGPPIDYAHLKAGNYWIYQIFEVDINGNATPTTTMDSVYAGDEKEINGKLYQVRMVNDGSGGYMPVYTRDSSGYRVAQNSEIAFSTSDYNTVFKTKYFVPYPLDTVAKVTYQMTDKNLKVTVPAGTFETVSWLEAWNMYPAYAQNGAVRKVYTRYNAEVGIVAETLPFYLAESKMRERRLVRYKVQ